MIDNLHIKNIGIIEELSIELNKGLNVLTGETGAGKTLIIDALEIIAGGRFSKEMIRKGEQNSFVEVCIFEPETSKTIIVSREINRNGKNLCKINGRLVTVNELKEFMNNYLEIHGQHDNNKLMEKSTHLIYVDNYIGEKISKIKTDYLKIYEAYKKIETKLRENYGNEKERERKLDLLKYQINEIEEANLTIGEESELLEKRKKMQNAEKIYSNLKTASNAIEETNLETVLRSLEKIETLDSRYENTAQSLRNMYYEIQEISRDISTFSDEIYFDEEERNFIEERLDLIYSLKRKYGNNIEEILEYKESVEKEIEHIENLEQYNEELRKSLKSKEIKMENMADKLHELRIEGSKKFAKKVNEILNDLQMKNAKLSVKIEKAEEYKETGKDEIEFFIKTNEGEDEKQLAKFASGGEISRIMLAIKSILAKSEGANIMVFDEIDTGISGKTANSVARLLSKIGKSNQVLCVSHLPNIVAIADHNYYISKHITEKRRTKTNIKYLVGEEVIREIARISSGEVNEISMNYASELRSIKLAS